jgi:diguanylate cyclase (GGDEF)-like protein
MIDKSLQEEDRKFQEEARRVQLFAQGSQARLYLVLAAVTFSPLLSFFLYFNSATTALHERLSELATVIVRAAASQIDSNVHALVVTDSEAGNSAYVQLANELGALQASIPQIESLSTLAIVDGQLFTIVDTGRTPITQADDPDSNALAVTEPFTGSNTVPLRSYMESAQNADIDSSSPFINESAGYMESCIPLSPIPGASPTLVCVEVSASEYFEQRSRLRNNFLLASLFMIGITAFIVYSVVQHQRQVQLSMSLLRKQRDYFLKSSRTDALTGVMNRRAFQRSYAVAEAQFNRNSVAFAVIAIDIDNFKIINDTYGHDAGDQVLVAVAAELSRVLRKTDFLARMGGEEFCVLCTLNEPGQGVIVAEKLRRGIEVLEVTLTDNTLVKVTISLGVHRAEQDQTMDDVLKAADIALYIAKSNGRNRSVLYTSDMKNKVRDDELSRPGSVENKNSLDWAD